MLFLGSNPKQRYLEPLVRGRWLLSDFYSIISSTFRVRNPSVNHLPTSFGYCWWSWIDQFIGVLGQWRLALREGFGNVLLPRDTGFPRATTHKIQAHDGLGFDHVGWGGSDIEEKSNGSGSSVMGSSPFSTCKSNLRHLLHMGTGRRSSLGS